MISLQDEIASRSANNNIFTVSRPASRPTGFKEARREEETEGSCESVWLSFPVFVGEPQCLSALAPMWAAATIQYYPFNASLSKTDGVEREEEAAAVVVVAGEGGARK